MGFNGRILAINKTYKTLCSVCRYLGCVFFLTDDGTHRTLCDRVGTKLSDYRRDEIPEVRRLAGTTSAGT